MVKVAAVQAAPVWMDAPGTVAKTINLIQRAAARDVKLLAFGQSWLPGYPWQALLYPLTGAPPADIAAFHNGAVSLDGPEMAQLQTAAADHSQHVILGLAERVDDDVYATHVNIASNGEVVSWRRASALNLLERRAWTPAQSEPPVLCSTELGTIGVLAAADNLHCDLQRQLAVQGQQIHVALWTAFCLPSNALPATTALAAAQHYAIENECYVLVATQVTTPAVCEQLAARRDLEAIAQIVPGGGAAAVFAPGGQRLTDPIMESEEGLVIADIDLAAAAESTASRVVRAPLREPGDALSTQALPPSW